MTEPLDLGPIKALLSYLDVETHLDSAEALAWDLATEHVWPLIVEVERLRAWPPPSCEGCGTGLGLLRHRDQVLCSACLTKKRAEDPEDGWYACPDWIEIS